MQDQILAQFKVIKIIFKLVPYPIFFRARVAYLVPTDTISRRHSQTRLFWWQDILLNKAVGWCEGSAGPCASLIGVLYLQWHVRGCSARKGYLSQAPGIWNGRGITIWSIHFKGWFRLTVVKCSYYIIVSVTFPDSLSQHSKNTWQSNTRLGTNTGHSPHPHPQTARLRHKLIRSNVYIVFVLWKLRLKTEY